MQEINVEQGSAEWLQLRRTKITSTDAAIIIGANPWKNSVQLRLEKQGILQNNFVNAAMQRGIDLEPVARQLYEDLYQVKVKPKVFVNDFMMASVDGIDESNTHLIEIKCSGEKVHAKALKGEISGYYYAQMQHQMSVLGLDSMYYWSFDGFFGHRIEVKRNDDFIGEMIVLEMNFYKSLFPVEHKSTESVLLCV